MIFSQLWDRQSFSCENMRKRQSSESSGCSLITLYLKRLPAIFQGTAQGDVNANWDSHLDGSEILSSTGTFHGTQSETRLAASMFGTWRLTKLKKCAWSLAAMFDII